MERQALLGALEAVGLPDHHETGTAGIGCIRVAGDIESEQLAGFELESLIGFDRNTHSCLAFRLA